MIDQARSLKRGRGRGDGCRKGRNAEGDVNRENLSSGGNIAPIGAGRGGTPRHHSVHTKAGEGGNIGAKHLGEEKHDVGNQEPKVLFSGAKGTKSRAPPTRGRSIL